MEINGIGYEIHMPMTCFYSMPDIGQQAIVYTHCIIREDTQLLFGFIYQQEQILFRELIKVNGVGPKLALMILSGMIIKKLISAIEHQEISILVKIPGVGKKIAERLVLEMKDRFKDLSNLLNSECYSDECPITNPESEAISALISLGYKFQEAHRMIKKVFHDGADCKVLIRNALRTTI